MKRGLIKKSYAICGLIQIIILLEYSILTYFMFKQERVILNPVPYTIGLWLFMIILDIVLLVFIFKKYDCIETEIDSEENSNY